MADRIKGITIEIGGDTSGLSKALSGVNKEINTTQSGLRDVEKLLKLDPKNTELLKQKQELLAKAVDTTKGKLDTLKEANKQAAESVKNYDAWKAAYDPIQNEINETKKRLSELKEEQKSTADIHGVDSVEYKELQEEISKAASELKNLKEQANAVNEEFGNPISQEQYDALQREIIETENQLKSLEKAAQSSNVMLNQIGTVADDIAEKTGNLAEKTKGLSTAASAGLAGMVGMAVSAGKSADDINTLSKVTGLTTEQIQKFQYASDIIDVSLDTLTGSMAKLTKNMQSAKNGSATVSEAFDELGISVTDSTGALRSNDDVFAEAIDSLGKIENETQRDALAMQIFGKSAQDLNPLILGGADALETLGKEAENAGLILSQDALDSANEFNDSIDSLKAKATGTFAEVGTEIATMLIPFMDELGEFLDDLMEKIRGMDEGQLKMIGTILLVVAAISPLFSAISKVASLISFVTTTVIPGLSSAISFVAANPIVLLIAAIVALVALIATKGDEIQAILQKADDFLQNIFAKDWEEIFGPVLGGYLNAFFANLKNIWDAVYKIFNGVIDFIRGVFTGDWERAWKGVLNIFGGIFDGLVSMAKAPLNGIIGLLNMAIGGINSLITGFNGMGFDMPKWLGGGSWHPSIQLIDKIPFLKDGGILSFGSAVVGEAGPELLTMMGNQAMVQPLTNEQKNVSVGGTQIYVYGAPGQDVHELARIISEEQEADIARKEAALGTA